MKAPEPAVRPAGPRRLNFWWPSDPPSDGAERVPHFCVWRHVRPQFHRIRPTVHTAFHCPHWRRHSSSCPYCFSAQSPSILYCCLLFTPVSRSLLSHCYASRELLVWVMPLLLRASVLCLFRAQSLVAGIPFFSAFLGCARHLVGLRRRPARSAPRRRRRSAGSAARGGRCPTRSA